MRECVFIGVRSFSWRIFLDVTLLMNVTLYGSSTIQFRRNVFRRRSSENIIKKTGRTRYRSRSINSDQGKKLRRRRRERNMRSRLNRIDMFPNCIMHIFRSNIFTDGFLVSISPYLCSIVLVQNSLSFFLFFSTRMHGIMMKITIGNGKNRC